MSNHSCTAINIIDSSTSSSINDNSISLNTRDSVATSAACDIVNLSISCVSITYDSAKDNVSDHISSFSINSIVAGFTNDTYSCTSSVKSA